LAIFKGHCVADIEGKLENMPPVKLDNFDDCINYVMLHKNHMKQVIIEDEDEYCIIHAVDGRIVFPKGYEDK
jgi:hypothetical protein